jgi:L-ascorbate metabolism protein UlaG (beta-lactamase superfamily)
MFEPAWFMQSIHMNPEQALAAHRALGAHVSVAMHFGTFQLADDGQREAPERLLAAITKAGDPELRFWVLGFGEGRDVPQRPNLFREPGMDGDGGLVDGDGGLD